MTNILRYALFVLMLSTIPIGESIHHVISGAFAWKSQCSHEYVFKTFMSVSPTQCRWKCRIRESCVSIHYYERFKRCELNGLIPNPYYNSSTAMERSCLFVSVAADTGEVNICSSGQCPSGQVCNKMDSTTYSCSFKECVFPNLIQSAKLLSFVYDVGKVTRYECESGYHGYGNDTITCLDSGAWTYTDFTCYVPCPVPVCVVYADPSPPLLSGNTYMPGCSVTYACAEGFILVSNDSIVCNASGQWQGVIKCQANCPPPNNVTNAVINTTISTSANVTYSCMPGYSASEDMISICTNGAWSPLSVRCNVNCRSPPDASNALIASPVTSATVGTVVEYSCDATFVADGSITSTCLSNSTTHDAQWSPPILGQFGCHKRCERPSITGGTVHVIYSTNDTSFPPLYTFQYSCNNGFVPEGERTLTCGEDGIWAGGVICSDTCTGVVYTYNETYGICYVAWDSILTAADGVCDIFDGVLMGVQSQTQVEFANAHIAASGISGLYIGSKTDVLGWPMTDWADGEPSGSGNCVEISVARGYQWNDIDCTDDGNYTCIAI